MKDGMKCPITLGEYERYNKNKSMYETLSKERKDWLDYFMFSYNYTFSDFVLKYDNDDLWVIINTGKTIKEFKI